MKLSLATLSTFLPLLSWAVVPNPKYQAQNDQVAFLESTENLLHALEKDRMPKSNGLGAVSAADEVKYGPWLNVTLHVDQGNVTFRDEYVIASPDLPPTIWQIHYNCQADYYENKGTFIQAYDEFLRPFFWNNVYDGVKVSSPTVGNWRVSVLHKKEANKKEESSIMEGNEKPKDKDHYLHFLLGDQCLVFNEQGVARTTRWSPCQDVYFKILEDKDVPVVDAILPQCS